MALPIVNTGLAIMAKRLMAQAGEVGSAQPEPKYLAWGTGTNAESVSATILQTPSIEPRVPAFTSVITTNVPNDTYQAVATITSQRAQAITELGQFDAPVGGNLFARWVFGAQLLNIGDSITFTTQIYGT